MPRQSNKGLQATLKLISEHADVIISAVQRYCEAPEEDNGTVAIVQSMALKARMMKKQCAEATKFAEMQKQVIFIRREDGNIYPADITEMQKIAISVVDRIQKIGEPGDRDTKL